jgi:hypothetical protein
MWGYNWQAHLVADAAAAALVLGSAVALGWLALVGHTTF